MASFGCSSGQVTAVVFALAGQPAAWRCGAGLCHGLGLGAGHLDPALLRLVDLGLLGTAWESAVPVGRPRRHRYRLSGPGRVLAAELAAGPSAPAKAARAVGTPGRQPRPRLEGT